MSQMHKIKTIVQPSNSDSSQKSINGFRPTTSPTKIESVTKAKQSSPPKNEQNNNNVMKMSMPPPIPPKKPTKVNNQTINSNETTKIENKLNNVTAHDLSDNNEKIVTTSDATIINHGDGQQHALSRKFDANEELHKLYNLSSRTKLTSTGNNIVEKGQNNTTVSAKTAADRKTKLRYNNNNNNTTNNDGISNDDGTSKCCDNKMNHEANPTPTIKNDIMTSIETNATDTTDSASASGAIRYTQWEPETVTSTKNNERLYSTNLYRCNGEQIINNSANNIAEKNMLDKHSKKCDILHEKHATSYDDENTLINSGDGDNMMYDAEKSHSDDFDDDPYAELQSYLEKVKREINEVFEQRKLNGMKFVDVTNQREDLTKRDSPSQRKLNMHLPLKTDQSDNFRRTDDWASSILRDLDNLVLSNKKNADRISNSIVATATETKTTVRSPTSPLSPTSQKRSTIINVVLRKTTPVASPTSPTPPTIKPKNTSLAKNPAVIVNRITSDSVNKILKPEKHAYIPLQSFNLETSEFSEDFPTKLKHKAAAEVAEKQYDFSTPSSDANNFPVLKIEEDFDDMNMNMNMINSTCKTISTQTSPTNSRNTIRNNKKGSSQSLWTSDESILRCGETVDEDNKSTSSSACEETGDGTSSNKSDSSSLGNDNAESGIGTATPPKDQETWRQSQIVTKLRAINSLPTTKKNRERQENVMTQTSPTDDYTSNFELFTGCGDDLDHLEVLSLCEGTESEYNNINDDYLFDDHKLDKSIDTASSYTKSSSAERDDDSDIIALRNQAKRTPSAFSLPQESLRLHANTLPINYSDKSLNGSHTTKSDSGSSSSGHGVITRFLQPTRRPFALHLNQEPFHNILELPSPSSASLHSGHGNPTMQELTTKSISAPILLKNERKQDDFIGRPINLRYSRSQSDRYLAEIEAIEACKWLRAAGFPQYAQMYEDLQFPIDLSNVAKDHPFLENDPLQSLYRRLVALNRCATMRLDSAHKHGMNNKEESEDDEYALSENWTFQQTNRRWSRVGEMDMEKPIEKLNSQIDTSRESSPEHNDTNDEQLGFSTLPLGVSFSQSQDDQSQLPVRLRRTGSERLKDGAKAFLRRVESIKSRRRKRQNRDGVIIIGPQTLELSQMDPKMNDMKCVNIITMSTPPSPVPSSPYTTILTNNKLAAALNSNELKVITTDYSTSQSTEKLSPHLLSPRHYTTSLQPNICLQNNMNCHSNRTSPLHFFSHNNPGLTKDVKGSGDDSSSYCSDASQESSTGGGSILTSTIPKKRPSRTRRFLQKGSKVEDIGALSDSECQQMFTRNRRYYRETCNQLSVGNNHNNNNNNNNTNNNNNNNTSMTEVKTSKFSRGGSLNLGKESQKFKESFKTRSFRSRSSARVKPDGEFDFKTRTRSSVVRWHSFQNGQRPDFLFKKCSLKEKEFIHTESGMSLQSMSCGQLQVVRKLALVTLTGCMERHCPTHRSGWNWELPKFIKKIKTPDYKDKRVFGVPLVLLLQRTGQTIPTAIQTALKWLKLNALDQVGLFRKSGVKSRIQKLKEVIEDSQGDVMETYDLQQAYDVADMLKQYFRELPDTLLTAKMSDTFIAIFQHLPPEAYFDAVQSAILLLPDEHREVLQYLLDFLHNVVGHSMINQMTSNNLAVCLAPSLFHGTFTAPPRSTSVSPRRRKPTGMPDSRELTETRASHDCLAFMIENCRKLFIISTEKVQRCNFNYIDESKPVPLEALGEGLQVHDWRGYLYECTSATIKEGRERSRGWISVATFDPFIEVANKKVGDEHPLRLWRCMTDIEATPMEILHFIFKERRQWDSDLMKCRIVEQLDDHSEIFQYSTGGHVITDYCVLRSWRADLPRGACVIVETSVAHPDAHLMLGGVRGVVLASRYLIEPIGNGKSKIMHLARVDTKGRGLEWYNKCYGHICSQYLSKIRSAFKHHSISSDGKC